MTMLIPPVGTSLGRWPEGIHAGLERNDAHHSTDNMKKGPYPEGYGPVFRLNQIAAAWSLSAGVLASDFSATRAWAARVLARAARGGTPLMSSVLMA